MKKILYILTVIVLAALSITGCKSELPSYSELGILFDLDKATLGAGESIDIPFTVTGTDGMAMNFTASTDVTGYTCRISEINYETNQGIIKLTAPSKVSKDTYVQVNLLVSDSHFRRLKRFVEVLVKAGGTGEDPEEPEDPEDPKEYGDLGIFFDAESFSVKAGGTVEIPFTVTGSEGATLSLKPSVDNQEYQCSLGKVDYVNYQGVIKLTAPAIVNDPTTVKVTLSVSDTHDRKAEKSVNVNIVASEKMYIEAVGDPKSMAVKAGGSFSLSYKVVNLAPAVIAGNPTVQVTAGWNAVVAVNEDIVKVTYTAPSSVTKTLEVKIGIIDDHSRVAEYTGTINIVEITEAAGAANCHIAKPGSTLTIKAVKGNSAEALVFDNACLVWQDARGLVTSVSGNGTDGVVVVQLGEGKSGNAVVAARSGNTVVWSWHVWVTDYDPEADIFAWTDANGVTYRYMDRNLGAMSAEKYSYKALGLMYQWGRKDPFPGGDDVESSVQVEVYNIDGKQIYMTAQERPVYSDMTSTNLQLAIENPFIFYYAPSSSWPSVDWLTDKAALQNNDLWGGVSNAKSIYDPCPEGWWVPAAGDGWGFRKEYKKEGKLNDSLPYDESYPWYQDYDNSIGFRYKTAAGKEYWFPLSGNIDCTKGTLQGVGGSALYNTRTDNSNTVLYENMAWGNPASETGLNRPYGAATRCVKQ